MAEIELISKDICINTYIVIPCSKNKENLKAKEFYLRNKGGKTFLIKSAEMINI